MREGYVLVVGLVLSLGCSSSTAPAQQFFEKAQSCGALSSGGLPHIDSVAPAEACRIGCMLETASCLDYQQDFCLGSTSITDACYARCYADFVCDDGSTTYSNAACNGYADCSDGSDELGCGDLLFTCVDEERISSSRRCDGYDDCSDGSDEVDCTYFTCADGTHIATSRVCDFNSDCDHGEDEAGCAMVVCSGI